MPEKQLAELLKEDGYYPASSDEEKRRIADFFATATAGNKDAAMHVMIQLRSMQPLNTQVKESPQFLHALALVYQGLQRYSMVSKWVTQGLLRVQNTKDKLPVFEDYFTLGASGQQAYKSIKDEREKRTKAATNGSIILAAALLTYTSYAALKYHGQSTEFKGQVESVSTQSRRLSDEYTKQTSALEKKKYSLRNIIKDNYSMAIERKDLAGIGTAVGQYTIHLATDEEKTKGTSISTLLDEIGMSDVEKSKALDYSKKYLRSIKTFAEDYIRNYNK